MRHSTISLRGRHIEPSSKSIASQVSQNRSLFPSTGIRIADLSLKQDRILHQITGNKSAAIQKIGRRQKKKECMKDRSNRNTYRIPLCSARHNSPERRDVFVLNGVVCHVTDYHQLDNALPKPWIGWI
jgi:hypothetical protein